MHYDKKGQTALEYLLIIAGAIAIAAIAIFVAMSSVSQSGATVEQQTGLLTACQKLCIHPLCTGEYGSDCAATCMAEGSFDKDASPTISDFTCSNEDGSETTPS